MKPSGNYSEYYNLLYDDKDYEAEGTFVNDLVQKYALGARNLLDLGEELGGTPFASLRGIL
jgi:hypothetical protein